MLKTIALAVLAALALLLIYAATRPDTFRVERSTTVKAPPEKLLPLIADLHAFNRWNPFNKKDPAIQGDYQGPASGPGAVYNFAGNSDVGSGRVSVTGVSADRVAMRLEMTAPMATDNAVEFKLQPEAGGATRVTWAMQGPSPFIAKLVGVVFNMDRMVGTDFEAGLASLKTLAETGHGG
jgi:hypothetical protein